MWAQVDAAVANGEAPLDYMLRVMRDPTVDHQRRDAMARAAASYVHPKLAAIEYGGQVDTVDLTPREIVMLRWW